MIHKLRYISVIVFGILVFITLISGIFFKYFIIDHMVKDTGEQHTSELTDTYVKFIWNKYYPIIGQLADKPPSERISYPQYLSLIKETESFFNMKNIIKVSIYIGGKLFISTSDIKYQQKQGILRRFLGAIDDNNAFELAKQEKTVGVIIPVARFYKNDKYINKSILKTFLPISVNTSNVTNKEIAKLAQGVIEIDYDISHKLTTVEFIQFIAIITIIAGISCIVLAVFFVSYSVENALIKREEEASELKVDKDRIEIENINKSKFLENVSEELRTPINAIISFSEIITTESMGPIQNKQYLEFARDIHSTSLYLLGLTNDIIDYSKAKERELPLKFDDINITRLMNICVRSIMPDIEAQKLNITQKIAEVPIYIRADYSKLKQVIIGLLTQAIKFTPHGGDISVQLSQNTYNNSAQIIILDSGVGINEKDLAAIISSENSMENPDTCSHNNLSLALNKKLIELMYGGFSIESKVGYGTKITITFPLVTVSI